MKKKNNSSGLGFVLASTVVFVIVLILFSIWTGSGRMIARFLVQFLR